MIRIACLKGMETFVIGYLIYAVCATLLLLKVFKLI